MPTINRRVSVVKPDFNRLLPTSPSPTQAIGTVNTNIKKVDVIA